MYFSLLQGVWHGPWRAAGRGGAEGDGRRPHRHPHGQQTARGTGIPSCHLYSPSFKLEKGVNSWLSSKPLVVCTWYKFWERTSIFLMRLKWNFIHICLFLITPCLLNRFVPLVKTVLQHERSSHVSEFYASL